MTSQNEKIETIGFVSSASSPASSTDDSSTSRFAKRKEQSKKVGYHGIGDVSNPIFHSELCALKFMIEHRLVDFDGETAYCPRCDRRTSCRFKKSLPREANVLERNHLLLRCKRDNTHEFSVCNGTIFDRRIVKNKILLAFYLWLNKIDMTRIVVMTAIGHRAVAKLLKSIRQACEAHYFDSVSESGTRKIGGDGIIVQIDEAKYGKRKYNRGHRVEGNWVFGGIEYLPRNDGRYKAGRFFATVVNKRNEAVLGNIIRDNIASGSIIYSDCWKAYENISEWRDLDVTDINGEDVDALLYRDHKTVNHSKEFKTQDGVHTNAIEGYWRVSKDMIPRKHYMDAETLQEHLFVHMWRSEHVDDLWNGLIHTLATTRYTDEESLIVKVEFRDDGTVDVHNYEYGAGDYGNEAGGKRKLSLL